MKRYLLRAVMVALPVLAACDNERLNSPDPVDHLFDRYVAIGNSITSGFQSGGINDSTQLRSYAVLLAAAMETQFNVPLLNGPGCPAPYTHIFAQTRLDGAGASDCALRVSPAPTVLNNVAIPGANVLETFDYFDGSLVPSETDVYRTVLLGGRTELEAARATQPTFVTVWLGNNDALGAVLDGSNPGNPAMVTAPATFAAELAAALDTLDSFGTIQGGVLIGAVQVGSAPYLTQGRVWKGFEAQFDALTTPLNALDVNNNCLAFMALTATDTAWVSVPFPVGGPKLSEANAKVDSVQSGTLAPQNLVPVVLDCSVDADVVSVAEMANLASAVAQYNAAIEQAATDHDWVYLDPNDLLAQLVADPTAIRSFPAFPGLPGITPQVSANEPFGWALSLDGIHPSSRAHVLVAGALIAAINARYGVTLE
jgi:hypothetical protein